MESKTCTICGQTKPLTEFYKNSTYLDGYEGRCKECRKAYQKQWRADHREEHRAYSRKHQRDNKEARQIYYKKWVTANADRKAANDRQWRVRNSDRVNDSRRVQNARRRALVMNAKGGYTPHEWRELKAKYGNRCLACGRSEPDIKLTPDHVVPLVLGGSNSIDNIQPLCWGCNAAKQARSVDYRTSTQTTAVASKTA